MTDEKKEPEDLADIDWDEALSEWESTNFVPEVAKDAATHKPGSTAGTSRPLYRPPPARPAPKMTLPGRPALHAVWSEDESQTGVTRMARVPEELLRPKGAAAPESGGALAQSSGDEDLEGDAVGERNTPSTPIDLARTAPPPPTRPPPPPLLRTRPATEEAGTKPPGGQVGDPNGLPDGVDANPRALPGPALLAPNQRQYDPNEVTVVGKTDRLRGPVPTAHGSASLPGQERPWSSNPPGPLASLTQTSPWPDEKSAGDRLEPAAREALKGRVNWLAEEARASGHEPTRARGLLACSEICASLGDREKALAFAVEARDLAPSLALSHRQARALMPSRSDNEFIEALDAEVRAAPTGAARSHSLLLAAEAFRASGRDDAAGMRLEQESEVPTRDVGGVVLRTARALARGDSAGAAAEVRNAPDLQPVADAVAVCLRLRQTDLGAGSASVPGSATEALLLARRAVDRGDLAEAAPLIARLATVPELTRPAHWLAAILGATQATGRDDSLRWLRALAELGEGEATRAVLARAIERDDRAAIGDALERGATLTSAERLALGALAGIPIAPTDSLLDATAATAEMLPLSSAASAVSMPLDADRAGQSRARSLRAAGLPPARALVRVGRLLAAAAPTGDIDAALDALGDARPPAARVLALEMAARAGRTAEVSAALQAWGAGWGSGEEAAVGALAAALVAERAGDRGRALESFKAARVADPTNEAALRAIASLEPVDLVAEMNQLADDLGGGIRAAVARIEAVTRSEGVLPEPTRAHLLERAHEAAPSLPVAAFLAERIARRAGDIDEVLRWIRERRARATDAVEAALDAVREALLIADREPSLSGGLLQEAHRARPNDVALRQLYERMAADSLDDRGPWREKRASGATGDARTLMLLEAAHEYERAGDGESALRCAEMAGESDTSLGTVARERAELRARRVSRLADELLSAAKGATSLEARREAYERLATIDAEARRDPASAVLWHRSILEESPLHLPSLRHLEHHLVGEGREDELEPIATAIATALRGTGAGEATAHAELAARLRLRRADARWEATRDVVELAAAENDPSLWSLRMLQAHARARGDEAAFLAATLRLVDRATRPPEIAALVAQAAEAASHLDRLDDARSLLERASSEDPGDVLVWTRLVEVRRRAGDIRGAAEACEALARSSVVRERQQRAWCQAGRAWQDDLDDPERAIVAFEAAAVIDIAREEVFERLCSLYESRKMHAELAGLLERRIGTLTDPDQRLAMEVRRGRVLLDASNPDGARRAFEAALASRPDDSTALAAFADLCVAQRDWESAEQALVRLARLLPTEGEQRTVYASLGDIYAHHLLNLSRAEVAFKEVLRRSPDDLDTMEKLVEIHKRQNDSTRAAELQQELVSRARSPDDKRKRLTELAAIHEDIGHDNRRTEQTLEAARREFPQDVGVLRSLAGFYVRHHQTPALNILLDRTAGDARRALSGGRITHALFEVLATVFDLRGNEEAVRITQAMSAALGGRRAEFDGAGDRALDARLDDMLAPEGMTAPMRALLAKTGEALDAVTHVDLRALRAVPVPTDNPLARLATRTGLSCGLTAVQTIVSPKLGAVCVPLGSAPAAIAIGESLLDADERVAAFLVIRALKLVLAKASMLARVPSAEAAVIVCAWLKCYNPTWPPPQGILPAAVNAVGGRLQTFMPRQVDSGTAAMALEAATTMPSPPLLGSLALAWANRVALLALGDANAALDAIALSTGNERVPRETNERAAWVARTAEARDLIAFAVSDAFAAAKEHASSDR
jgi:cellulose synthase operon protein C